MVTQKKTRSFLNKSRGMAKWKHVRNIDLVVTVNKYQMNIYAYIHVCVYIYIYIFILYVYIYLHT